VSQLYEMKLLIEKKIKADGLNEMDMKGKIGLRAGKMLAFIKAQTPDDPETVAKLRKAAQELLNLKL